MNVSLVSDVQAGVVRNDEMRVLERFPFPRRCSSPLRHVYFPTISRLYFESLVSIHVHVSSSDGAYEQLCGRPYRGSSSIQYGVTCDAADGPRVCNDWLNGPCCPTIYSAFLLWRRKQKWRSSSFSRLFFRVQSGLFAELQKQFYC